MDFTQFVIRFLTVASFSNPYQNPLKYITETYFSGESVLFIYWTNVSEKYRDQLINYWVSSEIVTFETCNCDYVTDGIIYERSYVENTIVLFGDIIPDKNHVTKMRQCLAWNGRSKILVIANYSDDIARIVLENIWAFTKAFNVTIMVLSMSSVNYYTSHPYQNFTIVELDQNALFPSKPLDNFQGSVIKIATGFGEPYVMKPNILNDYNEGLEIRMINSMSKKFNFRLEYLKLPIGQSFWLSLYMGKVVGNLGLLHRCEADLLFHGMSVTIQRNNLTDVTAVHTMDSLVWVVPIRPFTFTWKSIIILFKNELWGLLLATLMLITITLYLITKYEFYSPPTSYNFFDALFQTFGIHLSVGIRFYRSRQLYRLFLFGFSYYTMIIVALYQSSLITFLTTPGSESQYETIEEVLDDGVIGYFFTKLNNETDPDLWNRILQPGNHVYLQNGYEILRLISHNKTVYTYLYKSFVNYEVHKNLLDENHEPTVRWLPEMYKQYLVAIYTSRGHPLRDLISNEILRMSEAGLLELWMKKILDESSKAPRDESGEDEGPMALSVEHLKGAFYIVPLMSIIAGVVFICEVVYYWWTVKRKKKQRFDIKWKMSEIDVHARDERISNHVMGASRDLSVGYHFKRKIS